MVNKQVLVLALYNDLCLFNYFVNNGDKGNSKPFKPQYIILIS